MLHQSIGKTKTKGEGKSGHDGYHGQASRKAAPSRTWNQWRVDANPARVNAYSPLVAELPIGDGSKVNVASLPTPYM